MQVTKDFFKEIITNQKKLLSLNDVALINVPFYDELSVRRLWPDMQKDKEFMDYFPSTLPKDRLPDRVYFFNVLNTVQNKYMKAIVEHANRARNTIEDVDKAA